MRARAPLTLAAFMLVTTTLEAQGDTSTRVLRSMTPLATLQPVGLRAAVADECTGPCAVSQDTVIRRRRAVTHSEWYGRRLTVHRYASYVMVPLFIAQYALGSRMLQQKEDLFAGRRRTPIDDGLRTSHRVVAGGVGALFVLNTTTGLWNLIETRRESAGSTHRTVHAVTMLAADAGFVYTGVLGARASDHGLPEARTHRNVALGSFAIATAGAAWMWFGREE